MDEEKLNAVVDKTIAQYQKEVTALSPLIAMLAKHNPSRRARKLHIGLFGYSRSMNGMSLPRAIPFCSALYSIGVPPELLGLSALSEHELDAVRGMYVAFEEDVADSAKYACVANIKRLPHGIGTGIAGVLSALGAQEDPEYASVAQEVMDIALSDNRAGLADAMAKSAWKRNFLG